MTAITAPGPAHAIREGKVFVPQEPVILRTDDVARILTEEARAAAARRFVVKKLQPAVATAADLLPDEPLRDPPTKVDQAVADLKAALGRWARTEIRNDMSEQAIEEIVRALTEAMRHAEKRLGSSTTNPHAQAARRTITGIETLVQQFDARKRPTVSRRTVRMDLEYSYPKAPGRHARYADDPMPAPEASGRHRGVDSIWYASQEPDLRAWYRRRPGPGVGGGRPKGYSPKKQTNRER